MPILSYHYGLSPSDIWAMTHDEMDEYLNFLDEIKKAHEANG